MYLTLSDSEVKSIDQYGVKKIGELLSRLSYPIQSGILTAGSTGATTTQFCWVAPAKGMIEAVKFLVNVAQTGSGNEPTINLVNVTQSKTIGTKIVALSGSTAGQVWAVSATNANVAKGDVLKLEIVNPSATITVALQASVLFDFIATA